MTKDQHPDHVTHDMHLDYYSARLERKNADPQNPRASLISYDEWKQIKGILSPLEEYGVSISCYEFGHEGVSQVTITPKSIDIKTGEVAFFNDLKEEDTYKVELLSEAQQEQIIAQIKARTNLDVKITLRAITDEETIRKSYTLVEDPMDLSDYY